ncbi:3-hydroxyacyl-CoA dehydrogenase, partial [Thioclava sp. BHET1]
GAGITVALLAAGFEVALVEQDADTLVAGLERVAQLHDQAVAAKRMSEAGRDADWARLKGSADPAILADADLVIEAAPEDAALKSAIFAQLGRITKPGAILANTSAGLPIAPLAAASGRGSDVLGLHFFAPADQIRLIEVAVSPETAAETVATAFALARRMGRIAVRTAAGQGRLGRSLFSAGLSAVDMLRQTGTGSARIDAALRAYGFALGPYQMASYTGLIPTALEPGEAAPPTDPEDAEIQNRFLAAMANEGARMIEAGLVARPSDLDLLMVAGYGFPRWRGGPMNVADRLGILALRKRLQDYAQEAPAFWQPREILTELIKSGQRFYQLND